MSQSMSQSMSQMIVESLWGNPLLAVYGEYHGAGPDGAVCKTCVQLRQVKYHDCVYHKCVLRGISHGTASDHRVRWPACGRYVRREGAIERVEVW